MDFIKASNTSPEAKKILIALFENGISTADARKILDEIDESTKEINTFFERELAKKRADERANENEPASNCKKCCLSYSFKEETKYRLKWIYKDLIFNYYSAMDRLNRIATLAKISLFISILAFITAVAS